MKITVTVNLEFERADGSYTELTEKFDTYPGDNPRFEGTEALNALAQATALIARRVNAPTEEQQ